MTDAEKSIASDAFKELAESVGRVALAWGSCTDFFHHAFVTVTGLSEEMAEALWLSIPSDKQQRTTLTSAAAASGLSAERLKELARLVKRAEAVGRERNIAVHTVFEAGLYEVPGQQHWVVRVEPRPRHAPNKRLRDDHLAQFAEVERSCALLSGALMEWTINAAKELAVV